MRRFTGNPSRLTRHTLSESLTIASSTDAAVGRESCPSMMRHISSIRRGVIADRLEDLSGKAGAVLLVESVQLRIAAVRAVGPALILLRDLAPAQVVEKDGGDGYPRVAPFTIQELDGELAADPRVQIVVRG